MQNKELSTTFPHVNRMTQNSPFLIDSLLPILSKPLHLTSESPKWLSALYTLAQNDPNQALEQLEKLNNPESRNLKAYVFLKMKRLPEAEKVIEDNFIRYPNNLTVKINYADLCLRKKQWKEVSKIFPSIDLGKLYPNKTIFLVSEFRGFMIVMSYYHSKLRKYALAEKFYLLAVKADPLHPSLTLLERKIFQFRWIKRLAGILSSW